MELRVATRQLDRCLELFGCAFVHMHLHVCLTDLEMGGSKGGIHLQNLPALRNRPLIQTGHQKRVCNVSTDDQGKWVELFGLLHFDDGFVALAEIAEM